MTGSLELWLSFLSMLKFHPEHLGCVMDLPQWPKETSMIKALFTKFFTFQIWLSLKKIQSLVSMIPSALLNVKFYFWKTNPRKITRAFSQACTSNEQSGRFIFCPISLPSTLYCTVTIIVPWSLMGEKNNLSPTYFILCRGCWKYDFLHGLANNCFSALHPTKSPLYMKARRWARVHMLAHTPSRLPSGLGADVYCSSGSNQLSLQPAVRGPFNIFPYLVQGTFCIWNTPPGMCIHAHIHGHTQIHTYAHTSINSSSLLSSHCTLHPT